MLIKSDDRQSWFSLFKFGESLMILKMFYQFNYKRSWKNWKPNKEKRISWLFTDPINNSKLGFDQSKCVYYLTERESALNTFLYWFSGVEWSNTVSVWWPSILAFHNLHVDSWWDEVPAHGVQISTPTLPRDKLRGLRHLLCVYADHHKESFGKYKSFEARSPLQKVNSASLVLQEVVTLLRFA